MVLNLSIANLNQIKSNTTQQISNLGFIIESFKNTKLRIQILNKQ